MSVKPKIEIQKVVNRLEVTQSARPSVTINQQSTPTIILKVGGGGIQGPSSSTDDAVARFDGTSGLAISTSPVSIDDAGVLSGYRLAYVMVVADYTATASDNIIGVDSTSAPITVALQDPVAAGRGRVMTVKDEGGASLTNGITVTADMVDGSGSFVVDVPYAAATVYSNGAKWCLY
jgi:hypothetical protein